MRGGRSCEGRGGLVLIKRERGWSGGEREGVERGPYMYIMHCIFEELAQGASLSGYEKDTQRTWSVTILAQAALLR